MIAANCKSLLFKLNIFVFGFWMLGPGPVTLHAATANVAIGDNFFSPNSTTINVNDIVKWTWNAGDINFHSSTSDTGLWDSTVGGANMTFSRTFAAAGSFPYHCTIHALVQTGTVIVQAANTPPTVTITNPANGVVLSAPAAFLLQATASDPGGSVTNVQFRQGTTVLTNKASSPYFFSVSNLPAASYTFSAIASDNLGAKATNSVTITVNALPTVAVTNPANGSVFSAPATTTIMASASDSDGTVTNVQFLQDGLVLANRSSLPYSVTVSNLAAGIYALSAVASDNHGGKATNQISVSAETPVAIILSSPQQVSGTNFQFNYSANAGLKYVVEQSANLSTWNPLSTNTAAGNPVAFVHTNAPASPGFYRVGRLPNP
jgi:plastocyanin